MLANLHTHKKKNSATRTSHVILKLQNNSQLLFKCFQTYKQKVVAGILKLLGNEYKFIMLTPCFSEQTRRHAHTH